VGSQDQKPSRAERLAARANKVRVSAAGLDNPEATEDALQEAARLRAEAREAAAEERAQKDAQTAADIDAIRLKMQGRRIPGGAPLRRTEGAT
jgi:hypothetical protein